MLDLNICSFKELIECAFGESENNTVNFKVIQTILYLLARQLGVLDRLVQVDFVSERRPSASQSSIVVSEIRIKATAANEKLKPKDVNDKDADDQRTSSERRKIKRNENERYSSYSDEETETHKIKQKQRFNDKDKLGTVKAIIDGMNDTDTEKLSIQRAKSDEISDSSFEKWQRNINDKDLKFKRQREALFSKCPGFEQERIHLSDSTKSKSADLLIKSKDIENKKYEGSRKGGMTDNEVAKSLEIDKKKDLDDFKDSKKLEHSAKLANVNKSGDPKIQKQYDEYEGSHGSYEDEARKQSTAFSNGTEYDYIRHPKSELPPGKQTTGSKGGKQLRAVSREEPDRETRRMLSVPYAGKRTSSKGSLRPSQDIKEEKVLVVERIPLDKEKARKYKEKHRDTPLAVVKLEEFEALFIEVKELEARMRPECRFSFPGNAELLEQIRNGASLTEAMAALQLSARIEAAEIALENIIEMVSKLAAENPDVDFDKYGQLVVKSSIKRHETKPIDYLGLDQYSGAVVPQQEEGIAKYREGCITKPEFDSEISKVQKELAKEIGECAKKNLSKIDVLSKNLRHLESKVEDAVFMLNRISDLEDSVSSYSERMNAMDKGLSVQMTSFQDQLTHMQHELEEGLENMSETVANAEGDPEAVAELHAKLNILQDDIANTSNIQSELEKNENDVSVNLKDIFAQIEHLRETKSDREEVEGALRNKAGLSALNGLISLEHFDASIGDMEAQIENAYDKFNNQELIWQKAINDLVKELNEKTNLEIVLNLHDDINSKLNMMMERISSLRDIVGEPKAFGISKRINIGAKCLSCKTPAQMELEAMPSLMQAVKSSSASTGAAKIKEAGDACYPGYPIPHPLDPRTHICNRYCGGSHTVLKNVARAKSLPGALTINKWEKPLKTEAGTDRKAYLVDDPNSRGPCKPCNIKPSVSTIEINPKSSLPVKGKAVFDIEIRECDKCPCFNVEPELDSDVSLTG